MINRAFFALFIFLLASCAKEKCDTDDKKGGVESGESVSIPLCTASQHNRFIEDLVSKTGIHGVDTTLGIRGYGLKDNVALLKTFFHCEVPVRVSAAKAFAKMNFSSAGGSRLTQDMDRWFKAYCGETDARLRSYMALGLARGFTVARGPRDTMVALVGMLIHDIENAINERNGDQGWLSIGREAIALSMLSELPKNIRVELCRKHGGARVNPGVRYLLGIALNGKPSVFESADEADE